MGDGMQQLEDTLGGMESGAEPETSEQNNPPGAEEKSPEGSEKTNDQSTQPQQKQFTHDELEEKRRNEAFARLRAKSSQYKKLLDKVSKKFGVNDIDQLQEALDQEALEAEAKELKMSPEAIKRMKQLEQQNAQIETNHKRQQILGKFEQVQQQFDLNNDELKGFVEQLRERQVDILNTGIPIEDMYRAFNHDKIVKAEINKAKEEWIKQNSKASNSSGTVKNRGKGDSGDYKVNTMKELDNILKEL